MIAGEIKVRLQLELENVQAAMLKNEQRMLQPVGGYIRKTAQNSMKRGTRGQQSQPGEPPLAWTERYRKSIVYAYDPSSRSVVVGGTLYGTTLIPGIIEYGGMELLVNKRTSRQKVGQYRQRPALRLALNKAIDQAVAKALNNYVKP